MVSKEGEMEASTERGRKAAKRQKEAIQEACAKMGEPPQLGGLATKDVEFCSKWGRKMKIAAKDVANKSSLKLWLGEPEVWEKMARGKARAISAASF